MNNKNIHLNEDEDTYTIQPYDKELTLTYVVKCVKEVIKHAQSYSFTLIMPNGYYLDGLSETNNSLIQAGHSTVYDKYTQEELTI